jgi:sporulation-control protein spo0M
MYDSIKMFSLDSETFKDYLESKGDFEDWDTVETFDGKLSEVEVVCFYGPDGLEIEDKKLFDERKTFYGITE